MSMKYIREAYGVPAKRGGRILYGVEGAGQKLGVIVGSVARYLRIRLDGQSVISSYHPTWNIVYLPSEKKL